MKTPSIFLVLVLLMSSVNCQKASVTPTETPAIAQGTLVYFEGGGTTEIMYPPGYILMNCHWIDQDRDSSGRLYLDWTVDSAYINKFVEVQGTLTYYPGNSDSLHVHVTPQRTVMAVNKIRAL